MNIDIRQVVQEEEYLDYLKDLIQSGMIDGQAAIGIAKQVASGQANQLSDKQWDVFEKYVFKPFYVEECTRCACEIPWCEMMDALDNGGYCNYCVHMMEKDD